MHRAPADKERHIMKNSSSSPYVRNAIPGPMRPFSGNRGPVIRCPVVLSRAYYGHLQLSTLNYSYLHKKSDAPKKGSANRPRPVSERPNGHSACVCALTPQRYLITSLLLCA